LPGVWSSPSAPASTRIVPSGPPQPPEKGAAVREGTEVHLTFTAPEPLDAAPGEDFTIDVYRQVPGGLGAGGPVAAVPSGPVGTFPAATIRRPDGTYFVKDPFEAPKDTVYLAEIADPLGRRSPRLEVATL